MKQRHLLMGVGLIAAAALVAFGDNSPDTEVAEPVQRSTPPASAQVVVQSAAPAKGGAPVILRVQPRDALIGDGADRLGEGATAFGSHDWTPPPPPPPPVAPPPPPPAPTAPPLPFTYMGKAFEKGVWEVYLARADQTFIVQPKTVIDGMYRVDTIAPPVLTLTYLPLNQVQQLNIGAFD